MLYKFWIVHTAPADCAGGIKRTFRRFGGGMNNRMERIMMHEANIYEFLGITEPRQFVPVREKHFKDDEHYDFFVNSTADIMESDVYRRAFFYLMGVLPETRTHISELWEDNGIRLEGLQNPGAWQTSSTMKICRLAFNLYNGYHDTGEDFTPYDIYSSPEFEYMITALRIRFNAPPCN